MMIMDRFGAGGSFTEFYAMDFRENFVLMGHDGPGAPGHQRRAARFCGGWGCITASAASA